MIYIRSASEEDIPTIRQLAQLTWPEAYRAILSEEQLTYMLDNFYALESLLEQMQDGHRFFLALEGSFAIGFASWSVTEKSETAKLHKLYVLPEMQGKKVGHRLLETVASAASSIGMRILTLNVNRHNQAKDFYERNGFSIVGEEDIDIGQSYYMNDYVMEREL